MTSVIKFFEYMVDVFNRVLPKHSLRAGLECKELSRKNDTRYKKLKLVY